MRNVTRHHVTWNVDAPIVAGYDFWQAWEDGWEQDTLDTLNQFVTRGSMMVDIGAYFGPLSLWAHHLGAHVVAIEPDPVAFPYLCINVKANAPDITTVCAAISDHTGTCQIAPHSDGWGSSMTHLSSHGDTVMCYTLPDLFDTYRIKHVSLVKMDIEGGEAVVLEHAAPFLAKLGIPLLVAMHQPWWNRPVDPAWLSGPSPHWRY